MAYFYSLHNNPPTYSALKKKKKNKPFCKQCYRSCFACSLLSITPWKVSVCLGEPTTEM